MTERPAAGRAFVVHRPPESFTPRERYLALSVLVVGAFMVMLDATVVNLALPKIMILFGARVEEAQLVLTGYMLALAVIIPATGFVSDRLGSRQAFLICTFFFTVGSALCGFAWDIQSLVLFRVLQGLGGGMMMPLAMTILYQVVPLEQRGFVMSFLGLPLLLAPIVGPTVGGYLIEYVNWRVIFTLNIPVGMAGLFLGVLWLPHMPVRPRLKFDLAGFVLAAAGFSSVLYGLSHAPTDGWKTPYILALLVGGSVALLAWIVVELTVEDPLLELRVFRNYVYSLATLVNFILTAGIFSSMFLLPIFLQNLRGLTAVQTGLLFLPQAVAATLTMPIAGRVFDRFGARPVMLVGLAIQAYTTFRLAQLDVTTSGWELQEILIMRGMSAGMVTMPAMTTAMNTIPPHLLARASSLTNVLRQIFATFGTAIFATILQSRESYHYAMAAQTVTAQSPGVQALMVRAQQLAVEHGLTALQAKAMVTGVLAREAAIASMVRSFDDCFWIAAWAALLAMVPALFFPRVVAPRKRRGGATGAVGLA